MRQPALIEGGRTFGRRDFDFYQTPAWMTLALLSRVSLFDVLECCSGEDAIANVLRARGLRVWTNDLDPSRPAQTHLDVTLPSTWETLNPRPCSRSAGVTTMDRTTVSRLLRAALNDYLEAAGEPPLDEIPVWGSAPRG